MADIDESKQTDVVRINGRSEEFVVDSVQEDGLNKLLVKSTTVPDDLQEQLFLLAKNGTSAEMTVDGSSTPVVFTINAPATGYSYVISELRFNSFDNGIKIDNFMALNSELSVGINVQLNTNGSVTNFLPIKTTADFNGRFAFGANGKFDIIIGSGNDYMTTTFSPEQPFKLNVGSGDCIKVTINDNLSSVSSLRFLAYGYKDN